MGAIRCYFSHLAPHVDLSKAMFRRSTTSPGILSASIPISHAEIPGSHYFCALKRLVLSVWPTVGQASSFALYIVSAEQVSE